MAISVRRHASDEDQHPITPLRVAPRRQPRSKLLLGSVALLVTCGALFATAYARAGHMTSVLSVDRAVPAGQVVSTSDLSVVRIAASGHLSVVPVGDASLIVGRRASVALVPGQLVTFADVSGASTIPNGDAIVGIAARSSQLPAGGIQPGQTVDVVMTGVPGAAVDGSSASVAGTVLASNVVVVGVQADPTAQSDTSVVSVVVPVAVAPALAVASTAGQVALVSVPEAAAS
ncbi:MAG: SAF domain-containing protein [Acidimicrobiales bacterium]